MPPQQQTKSQVKHGANRAVIRSVRRTYLLLGLKPKISFQSCAVDKAPAADKNQRTTGSRIESMQEIAQISNSFSRQVIARTGNSFLVRVTSSPGSCIFSLKKSTRIELEYILSITF